MAKRSAPLAGYAVFAAMLSSAGLPIYVHAPKFYVDEYGLGLAALGGILFGLRLFDVVQDPALGWLARTTRAYRRGMVAGAVTILAASMYGLFAIAPPIAPVWWFALTLIGLFSSFSFLTICFYAEGVQTAERLGTDGHLRLATWRETGGLLGVCLASVAPIALASFLPNPFTGFAIGFVGLCALAYVLMRPDWGQGAATPPTAFGTILRDQTARRLLGIALINAAPVAVTSTLFLFYVEGVLQALGWEGPLLLLFFLAAALSAPFWTRAATRFGAKPVLLFGMALSILAFAFTLALGAGDVVAFALICLASGMALGADLTILPAIFSRHLSKIAPEAGAAFGLWSFATKFTLAFAAVTLLPLLEAAGFEAGATNPEAALSRLVLLYAAVPCALKLLAITILSITPLPQERAR